MIELPTDLISQATHWTINDGKGQIHSGYPLTIQYNPEQQNENSYIIVQDNYVEEEKKEEVWPPLTFFFTDCNGITEISKKIVSYQLGQEPKLIDF